MKLNKISVGVIGVLSSVALTACPGPSGFQQPENTVPVNFSIDASGRPGYYSDGDLEWKGSFSYDAATRILSGPDTSWAGPFPPLYDDGPWTEGGHEPVGATAGDDQFGITVFFTVPSEEVTLEYGAQEAATEGWIWEGANGTFTVPANASSAITADGMALAPFGDVDLRLTLDTTTLDTGFAAPTTSLTVKGTFSTWAEDAAFDDGTHGDATANDGIYTYTLSEDDDGRQLVSSGNTEQFVWVIDGAEYKVSGEASNVGVKAFTMGPSDADFMEQTVIRDGGDNNTAVVIP